MRDTFTVADINAGSVVNIVPAVGYPLDPYPNTKEWLHGLKARRAYHMAATG